MKKNILVVDDNPAVFILLKKSLGDVFNYKHILTPDGIEQTVKSFKPDIIIMDILMPGIEHDGATATLALKNNPELKNIPVIIVTSIAQDTLMEAKVIKEKTKADYVFLKPFDKDLLREKINELIL